MTKPCCQDENNLGPVERVRPDLTFRRCQVCMCRHFEAVADPGAMITRGGAMGSAPRQETR